MRNLVKLIIIAFISNVCFTQCSSDNNIVEEIIEEIEKDSTITEEPKDSVVEEVDSVIVAEVPNPLFQLMMNDSNITLFVAALEATGIAEQLECIIDSTYNAGDYSWYWYRAHTWSEVGVVPERKMNAYTLFLETDSVLMQKYGVYDLEDLCNLARQIYDNIYPTDAGMYDEDMTHPNNPLYRFVAYHILNRDIRDLNLLTGRILNYKSINEVLGIHTDRMNPIEWYQTLLPNTMVKCEMLTMSNWVGTTSKLNNYYLNRRWDDSYQLRGAEVIVPSIENATINGRYFYVDDLLAFTEDVRDKVQNMLIRMDFSTVFPELMTAGIRQNGDPTKDDNNTVADETFVNGKNYWLPDDFLDGLTYKNSDNNGKLVYRRPHINFWSYQGDEFMLYGDYDIEISLPPVPFPGEWQVRLGYTALATRGTAQIYFDGVKQGEPIDERLYLNDEEIIGDNFRPDDTGYIYMSLTDEEKAKDQKTLKEKGVYRGPRGGYHTNGNTKWEWVGKAQTYRRVISQLHIDNTKKHTLRFQAVGGVMGNNNEFMLDYIEFVPQNVYDIPEGKMESDL